MGQHNTVPFREYVPGVSIDKNLTMSTIKPLEPPIAASHIRSPTTMTSTKPNFHESISRSNEPCVFRVPSVPYANSRVEITSETPTACSIQLPNGRGLVFENVFVYRNSKDQIVFTSADKRMLTNKLSSLNDKNKTISTPLSTIPSSNIPFISDPVLFNTRDGPPSSSKTLVSKCGTVMNYPFKLMKNIASSISSTKPKTSSTSWIKIVLFVGTGASALAIYFA